MKLTIDQLNEEMKKVTSFEEREQEQIVEFFDNLLAPISDEE